MSYGLELRSGLSVSRAREGNQRDRIWRVAEALEYGIIGINEASGQM